MNLIVILDNAAKAGEAGFIGDRSYRVTVNGRKLNRCTFVFAVLGFGMARFDAVKNNQLQVIDGIVVEGVTFGRIKVELL